jgi:hypothetical protein
MKSYLLAFALLFFFTAGSGQKALKLGKQKTTFFYAQLNLHGGYVNDINGDRWDIATKSPKNQVVFQAYKINQRNLQRGYTRLIAVSSWKARLGLEYDNRVADDGIKHGNVNFKLLDTFVKFKTKWDRTSIVIGNKSIPYGHNPKIDPVVSFMINPIKMDLGFAQDIGIFVKTPVAPWADVEVSFTSGGVLNKPVLVCNNLIVNDESDIDLQPRFEWSKYNYNDTWLFTGRMGTPTYKTNELGVNAVAGNIVSTTIKNDLSRIYRGGLDWVFKYNERVKMVNQVMVGQTVTSTSGTYFSTNIQNNLDFYSGHKWMFSASHRINALSGMDVDNNLYNWSVAGSLTYAFSPHTRLRLNSFYTEVRDANEKQTGVFLQFVTGFGKRP